MKAWQWIVAGASACFLMSCGGGGSNGMSATSDTSTNGTLINGTPTNGMPINGMSTMMPMAAKGAGATYRVTNLASDGNGTPNTDPNLVNGWGVAFNPQGFVWVAANET